MSRWGESESWVGENLRREAFFFPSRGDELYGSAYAPPSSDPPLGMVFCNSWGFEGNQASRIGHWVSYGLALAGAVGFSFHYPGFGDSHGDLAAATLDRLAAAAVDAAGEAARRFPGTRWVLVGPMLGASVAALAADRGAQAERLVLVQPALRPSEYFERLERASRRSLGNPPSAQGYAYGYPLGEALLESAAAGDAAVDAALGGFDGDGIAIAYETPADLPGVPSRFEQRRAPGVWRFGKEDTPELIRATSAWLRKESGMLPR